MKLFEFDFSEKTILITGASSGLGQTLAIGFSRLGARIILMGRDNKRLELVQNQLLKPLRHVCLSVDLRKPKSLSSAFEKLKEETSHIDILINNAGSWFPQNTLSKMQDAEIVELFETNSLGTVLVTKYAQPFLEKGTTAQIINVASISSLPSHVHQTSTIAFSASKRALVGFSEHLRSELKSKNIAVSIFYPGGFPGGFRETTDLDFLNEDSKNLDSNSLTLRDIFESFVFMASRAANACVPSLILDNR